MTCLLLVQLWRRLWISNLSWQGNSQWGTWVPRRRYLRWGLTGRGRRLLKLSQVKDIEKVLRRFNMVDVKPVNVPLGGHFKLSKPQELKTEYKKTHAEGVVCIRCGLLDICYGLYKVKYCLNSGVVSRYMSNPEQEQWREVNLEISKRKFWYSFVLWKHRHSSAQICWSGFAGDVDSRRSTTGYVFTLGSGALR